jgi:hypothetical protein
MMIEEKLSSAKLRRSAIDDQVCGGFDIICCGLAEGWLLFILSAEIGFGKDFSTGRL